MRSAQGSAGTQPAGSGWGGFGVIADVEPELDLAEYELRNREIRLPLALSIGVIAILSAGLWLGIFTLIGHIVAKH